jgi:hypothetical protein
MFDPTGQSEGAGKPGEAGGSLGEPDGVLSAKLFELLTDALRSGPGSASWTAAVEYFCADGRGNEYKRLLEARERLESGKNYRSMQSSSHLARAVLASVAAEDSAPRARASGQLSARTMVLVGALAAACILVFTGLVIEIVLSDAGYNGRGGTIRLPAPALSEAGLHSFDSIVPVGWQTIGSLRVKAEHGLRLAGGSKQLDQSGGLFWQEPLPKSRPFRLEAKVRYMGSASVSPEVFLTDEQTFDDDRPAERNHEFAWTVLDDKPRVRLADQTLAFSDDAIPAGQTVTLAVEIKVDGASASVATDNGLVCSHWAGAHLLDSDKPWHMGVRFVVHGTRHDDCVAIDAIRLH